VTVDVNRLRNRLPSAKQVAADLYGVQWRGDKAKCPRAEAHAHGDRDPSFAFLEKQNRLHCFSQLCFGDQPIDVFDFVQQMERCDFPEAVRRLAERYAPDLTDHQSPPRAGSQNRARNELEQEGWKQVAEYPYGDRLRKVRFEHPGRIQPEKNRPAKTFLWEHCDAGGQWRPGRGGHSHRAYVNGIFLERDQIESALGVESERSADAVGTFGMPAFSFKELTAGNAATFAGIDVRLLPDKDEAGYNLVRKVSALLEPHVRSIAIVEPPEDWPTAGDIYDAVNELQWSRDDVDRLLSSAKPARKDKNQCGPDPEVLSVAELLALDVPAPEMLIESFLPKPGACLLFGGIRVANPG
jgi:CHC2 zinc finger